jgi:putative lipoic acid-binding regulatory protein
MKNCPSIELLESTHFFPGEYQIKAIGTAEDDFANRVVNAVLNEVATPSEVDYSVRTTPGGRHVALTLNVTVQSAAQVRGIYSRLHEVKGLMLLF